MLQVVQLFQSKSKIFSITCNARELCEFGNVSRSVDHEKYIILYYVMYSVNNNGDNWLWDGRNTNSLNNIYIYIYVAVV